MKVWIVIAVVALLNYASRLSFIAFFSRRHVPPLLGRALRYVPAAMLTALIVPMIVVEPGPAATTLAIGPRVAAAALAAIVALRTRDVLLTIGAGMAALWLLQAALPAG